MLGDQMLSEKKEQKLINTNVITTHNATAISRGQQSWISSFSLIQACLQFFKQTSITQQFKI